MTGRRPLNRLLVALAGVLVAPLELPAAMGARLGGAGAFLAVGQFLGLVPGRSGQYLRAGFYVSILAGCAPDVVLEFMTSVSSPNAVIGAGVVVGSYVTIRHAEIGAGVVVGNRVVVGGDQECVHLGAGCVLGDGALILADVGAGARIAPGSVVTRPVPKDGAAMGHPLCMT